MEAARASYKILPCHMMEHPITKKHGSRMEKHSASLCCVWIGKMWNLPVRILMRVFLAEYCVCVIWRWWCTGQRGKEHNISIMCSQSIICRQKLNSFFICSFPNYDMNTFSVILFAAARIGSEPLAPSA